jgi:N-acetyl-alpha-D-glucosaminyl L-malate synthase BshA
MNIGIVLYPTFGGSGVVATELGKALAAKGHRIHFISYKQPVKLNAFTENLSYHEVNISNYPLFDYQPYELALASKLVDVVKFEGLDLLHVHYAIPHASAAYMAKQILATEGIHIPFITTLHGTDITLVGKDSSFEPVITFAMNQSDAITAVSQSLADDTYAHFDVKKKIHVIPNFICFDQYPSLELNGSRELRQRIAPKGEKIIAHISNFRKVKRVEDVIMVFEKVRQQFPVKLMLIGDGPLRHKLEEMCREMGSCDDVKFLGKLKDTEEVLAISDLFLLTSQFESFGLAALEAMAAGVPVISTNTGGIPEVNIHGESGFLSNVGDVEDMAKNALFLLKDEAEMEKFRKGAFQRAKTFEIDKILPRYEQLYEEVLKNNEIKK